MDASALLGDGGEQAPPSSPASLFERAGATGQPKKRAVVLSARVHPGETNASFIMSGLLLALTEDTELAYALR